MIDHQMEHILVKRNNLDSSNALSTCLIKHSPLLHARHACQQGMGDRDPFANTIRRMNAPRHWMQLRLNELQMQTQCKKSNTQNQVNASHGMKYSPPPKNKHFTESAKQTEFSFTADSSHPSTGFIDPFIDPFKNSGQALASKTVAHAF